MERPYAPTNPHVIAVLGEGPPPPAGPRAGWSLLNKHGACYVCDRDNPGGLRTDLFLDGEVVRCPFVYGKSQEGPPGHAHGGSTAALLDEVMGAVAWLRRPMMLAAHLEFDYRRPVPQGQEHQAIAWLESEGNRSLRIRSHLLLADGTIAVEGRAVFAQARSMFEGPFYG